MLYLLDTGVLLRLMIPGMDPCRPFRGFFRLFVKPGTDVPGYIMSPRWG